MKLYHVSPYHNRRSILSSGLRSKRGLVWLIAKKMLPWALCHVAQHQGVEVDDLDVYQCRVSLSQIKKAGGLIPGRYMWYCRRHGPLAVVLVEGARSKKKGGRREF